VTAQSIAAGCPFKYDSQRLAKWWPTMASTHTKLDGLDGMSMWVLLVLQETCHPDGLPQVRRLPSSWRHKNPI